jgi:hypothetical protein
MMNLPSGFKKWQIRIKHWEYWPFAVVYFPIIPIWWWYCLKARSFFFFNAANPSIENGGFLMERKSRIYPLLPAGTYPATLHFEAGTPAAQVLEQVQHLEWPLIAKPDIGMQGKRVKKLNTTDDLIRYAAQSPVDFLVQAFIDYPEEAGIFYVRIPGEKEGKITGIVQKHFASVTGDGIQTVEQLLLQNDRYVLQWYDWKNDVSINLQYVPAKGEQHIIAPYGNHARGALFVDATFAATADLTKAIDDYCQRIPGFYYGRLDIRFTNWQSLGEGKNFSVIELNGAGSEPTHMYDPKNSLWTAWKEIIRHWSLLYQTATSVNRTQKVAFIGWKQGIQMFRNHRRYQSLLEC